MYIQIQFAKSSSHREAMGKVYQAIADSSYWEKADAIFHDYNKQRITIDVAQPDVTDEQEDWLANQRLIEKWWKSWDRDDTEISKQQYIIEVVHRYNLSGVIIPDVEFSVVGSGNFFSVYHAEVTEQQLEEAIERLEEATQNGDIITYFYQQRGRSA